MESTTYLLIDANGKTKFLWRRFVYWRCREDDLAQKAADMTQNNWQHITSFTGTK
jgi:hypothetical protein